MTNFFDQRNAKYKKNYLIEKFAGGNEFSRLAHKTCSTNLLFH